ncbi:efflux RND transporter permease subunit [candidate division KSB1 bacterium]|nr:efflux RND transporter permease subunit [candidate division KSB1 bacterium]
MTILQKIINRPIAVSMFMLVIVVTGIYSAFRLPLELTPKAELPKLAVHTTWPNASPEAVEAFITSPIEAVVASLPGVQNLTSISREGRSQVDVEFTRDTRIDFAALRLSEQLALVRENLPHNATTPQIQKFVPEEFRQEAFLSYQFTGPYSLYEVRQMALEKLRNPLLAVPGVADVLVHGGQDLEIHILLDRRKMANLNILPNQIHSAMRDINLRKQGGVLDKQSLQTDLIVLNPIYTIDELRALPIPVNNTIVRLGEIATVERAYQNVQQLVRIDGNPSVSLILHREPGTNTISVANESFKKLKSLIEKLPPGMRLLKIYDESEQIRSDLQSLTSRSAFCLVIIFVVLFLFLGSIRLPFLVMSTVAFAILLTLNLFYFFGLTLNILTLAGLALGFGMLVDNAIVVIDNIHINREKGLPAIQAAVNGTKEVFLPLLASTLTTVVVFLPFLYLTGELRVFYLPFTLAVCLALLSSLLVALLFTPAVAARTTLHAKSGAKHLDHYYQVALQWSIRWPLLTVLLTVGLFFYAYYNFDKNVTKGRIWSFGGGTYLECSVRMPKGAQLQRADDIAHVFEDKVVGLEGIKRVTTNVFPERVKIRIDFLKSQQMTAYPLILKEQLMVLASRFAGIGISVYGFGPGFYSGLGGSAPNFRIQVLGYNFAEVRKIAEDLGSKLQRNARIREINTSGSGRFRGVGDQTETILKVKHAGLSKYGLTVSDVLSQVSAYLRENQSWQKIRLEGKEQIYRIKYADFKDFDLQDLYSVTIRSGGGESVRLNEIASIVEVQVQSEIVRENQQYQRWVTFEYRGPYKFGNQLVDGIIENTELPPGYKLERPKWFLSEEEEKEIYTIFVISFLLVFMVVAALYESLVKPFIIMLTVPLGLIGVFLIFWLTETNFDRSAYIGVILLSGIVVNNAILMVAKISNLHKNGTSIRKAIIEGASQRLRPILMTTMTTVFGLLPLVISGGESRLWGTLALSTIGGLTTSAFFVLFVTPAIYRLLSGKKNY